AELELRLVTRLRDTDQAFRMPGDRFVVVFARTSKVGARRACHRLAEGMPAGVLIDLVHWPEDTGAPPAEVVGRFLARSRRPLGPAVSPAPCRPLSAGPGGPSRGAQGRDSGRSRRGPPLAEPTGAGRCPRRRNR